MHLGRAFERFWLRAETASHRSQGSIPISRLLVSNRDRKDDLTSSITSSSTVAGRPMEKPEGSAIAVSGDRVTVPVTPFEIQTVRVEYGHAK
jgi:alpha-mannosidase